MIAEAERQGVIEYMPAIIATFEKDGIGDTSTKKNKWKKHCGEEKDSDFIAQYNLFHFAKTLKTEKEFKDCGINKRHFEQAVLIEEKLAKILNVNIKEVPSLISERKKEGVLKAIGSGLIQYMWFYNGETCRATQSSNYEERNLSNTSVVEGKSLIVGKALNLSSEFSHEEVKLVTVASKIKEEWLKEIGSGLRVSNHRNLENLLKLIRNTKERKFNIRKRDMRKATRAY